MHKPRRHQGRGNNIFFFLTAPEDWNSSIYTAAEHLTMLINILEGKEFQFHRGSWKAGKTNNATEAIVTYSPLPQR